MSYFTDTIAKDPRFHSTKRIQDMSLLEPVTRAAVESIIADAEKDLGIILVAIETYRSTERQEMLFVQKATKLKKVGVHHYGLATDFAKRIAGEISFKGDFSFLVALCKKHGLISGNNWGQPKIKHTFIDPGHVQRVTIPRQASLFAGTWYPEPLYNPYLDGAA